MNTTAPPGRTVLKYRIHWHILLTHFPISFFLVSFAFMALHLFTFASCFELASAVTLVAGTAMIIPTTWTGWLTWKSHYKGAKVMLFQRKITISFAMIAISIVLTIWRAIHTGLLADVMHPLWHYIYFAGTTALLLGAVAEGYYGGRLNHR